MYNQTNGEIEHNQTNVKLSPDRERQANRTKQKQNKERQQATNRNEKTNTLGDKVQKMKNDNDLRKDLRKLVRKDLKS